MLLARESLRGWLPDERSQAIAAYIHFSPAQGERIDKNQLCPPRCKVQNQCSVAGSTIESSAEVYQKGRVSQLLGPSEEAIGA